MEKVNLNRKSQIYLALLLLLKLIAYSDIFHNGFVSFDDRDYVTDNPVIRDISFTGIKVIFSSYVAGNYHPITVLFDAVIYHFFKLNSLPYHAFILLLHLINIILVFIFISLIDKNDRQSKGKTSNLTLYTTLFVAALFALHPMHTETVNWVSDLKDLTYTLFFLSSLICYIKYIRNKTQDTSINNYILCIFFFLMSLLSKSAAVTLPFVLLLLDYWYDRKFRLKIILEKLPFFIL